MLTTRASHLLAIAATLALGTGVAVAQDATGRANDNTSTEQRSGQRPNMAGQDNAQQQGQENGQSDQSDQAGQPGQGGQMRNRMQDRMRTGMHRTQGDQVILSQLQQIRQSPNNAGDKLFVLEAACGNLKEIRTAELVSERAQDQQVKDLANQIKQDHQKAQDQLRPIAQQLNVQVPNELTAQEQAMLDVKRQIPVEDLEKGYLVAMKADHAKDIITYQDHKSMVKNDQLKQYISQTLPVLHKHADMTVKAAQAKGIQGDLNLAKQGSDSGSGDQMTGERRE